MKLYIFFALLLTIDNSDSCQKTTIATLEGNAIYKHSTIPVVFYKAKMAIDADGSPHAYHPQKGKGLDHIDNAGKPGNWWGVVTDDGKKTGNPLIQNENDPAPGYYISPTSLEDKSFDRKNPKRYVNSEEIPFIVLPKVVMTAGNIKLGDIAWVYNTKNQKQCWAIFADVGPKEKIGEGSIKLAQELGLNGNPRKGGTDKSEIIYLVFPGSGSTRPLTRKELNEKAKKISDKYSQLTQIKNCI